MAAAATLKNGKIAISLQWIDGFWRNLVLWCISLPLDPVSVSQEQWHWLKPLPSNKNVNSARGDSFLMLDWVCQLKVWGLPRHTTDHFRHALPSQSLGRY